MAYAFASRPGQPEQIEALRCLSLVLSALPARRPQGRLTAELAKAAAGAAPARSGFSSDWLDDVRGGVASVLGAKAPRELKHVALDLCAACVDLAGPAWLCSDALGAGATSELDAFARNLFEMALGTERGRKLTVHSFRVWLACALLAAVSTAR